MHFMSQRGLWLKWMFQLRKTHAQRLTPLRQTSTLAHTHGHWPSSQRSCTHIQYFPRQRVIRQTLLADWNEERINSRWYHWEKMEHNVENAPCLAATGRHNQEREQILGMWCNREAKLMPYDVQSTGTGFWRIFSQIMTCVNHNVLC